MSREKVKVPGRVFEELTALQREIHFTLDSEDTIKKAEDRGYMNAANWIRQNDRAFKIGFSWGFEPGDDEPHGTLRDIPVQEAPAPRRTVSHPPPQTFEKEIIERRSPIKPRKSSKSESNGIFVGIKNWLGKYF